LFPPPIRKLLAHLVLPMYVLEEKVLIVLHVATGKIIVRRKGVLRKDMRRDTLVLGGALLGSRHRLWVDVSHVARGKVVAAGVLTQRNLWILCRVCVGRARPYTGFFLSAWILLWHCETYGVFLSYIDYT